MKAIQHPLLAAFVAAGLPDTRIAAHYGVSSRTVLRWRQAEGIESKWAPETWHGISRYLRGCRCDGCRAAMSEASRRYRSHRKEQLVDGVAPTTKHNLATATNWGCRCDVCTELLRAHNRAAYVRRTS